MAENQSGPSTNLLESYFRKLGKDKRIKIKPRCSDYTSLTGLMIMKFDIVDINGNKNSRQMQGTGTLYHRLSDKFFVIVSAAHNFI